MNHAKANGNACCEAECHSLEIECVHLSDDFAFPCQEQNMKSDMTDFLFAENDFGLKASGLRSV